MIVIVDYGMGNLGSVKNMLKKVGADFKLSSSADDIKNASKLILPGVGSFDKGIQNLKEYGYFDLIKEKVIEQNTPILGICLGMQLLGKSSEEGLENGFCFVDAIAKKFSFEEGTKLKVPHMGWNVVNIKKENNLYQGIEGEQRFYFVHSFAVKCNDNKDILTSTNYGYKFVSSFQKNNIIGVQFHPEKSHKFGINFFKNFVEKY